MTPAAHVTEVLNDYVGIIVARSIVTGAASACGLDQESISPTQVPDYLGALEAGVRAFVVEPDRQHECATRLRLVLESGSLQPRITPALTMMTVDVSCEIDIVTARNHTKTMCNDLGFSASEQVKVATIVSELARNIVLYVGRGRIELEAVNAPRRGIEIRAIDNGRGIPDVDNVLSGQYRSKTGMGVGLLGTRRLMDEFNVETSSSLGTRVVVRKYR